MPGETVYPIKLFVDDTTLFYRVSESYCQQIQDDLNTIQLWAKIWKFKFHPKNV